jgi:phospholipid-translocating ATPase
VRVKSKDLRVGDIVKMEGGDRVPADLITLYSDNDQGTLFLKTDQLDGETDWKLRKSVKMTQSLIKGPDDFFELYNDSFHCEIK